MTKKKRKEKEKEKQKYIQTQKPLKLFQERALDISPTRLRCVGS